jgi:glycosyltransferase involved in cell wall biosynthesis
VKAALRAGERFDIAHQVVPVAMRFPTPVVDSGIPFVIGPVGGGLLSPPAFVSEEGSAPWYTNLRAMDRWRLRHDPLLRRTYEGAACVLAIAPYVFESLAGLNVQRLEIMAETGVVRLPPPVNRSAGLEDRLRLLYVGRLVRTKGVRDAINAVSHLADLGVVLDVVGEGPDRAECEALVKRLGLRAKVVFHGRLPRARVDEFYRRADVFVFPSYREPGGNVQFEAMAHALPLIVSDRGGPAETVDRDCALTVHATTPEQYALDIAAAIRQLADPGVRRRMGAAARDRVKKVGLWETKFDRVDDLYRELLESA